MDTKIMDEGKSDDGALYFLKKISQYFMDFLETDFHKRKIPKRNIKLRNPDNLLIGLSLKKYPSFEKLVWKAVGAGFSKEALNKITKGVHTTNIPENLLDLIKLQTGKITNKELNKILAKVADDVEKNATLYKKEYSKALSTSLDEARKAIEKDLTMPLIQSLEKSLTEENLGDENAIYLMEEELGLILLKLLEESISESLKLHISGSKVNIKKELESRFSLKEVKQSVVEFFDDFKVTDLYSEVYEIDRNRNILDKQEFYLYFGDITYNKAKYPIFYIPFSLVKEGDSLLIEFDSQVYINKRALEFIVQEFNLVKEKRGNLKLISERIIYLAQDKDNFLANIQNIVNEIVDLFDLDSSIDLKKVEIQTAKSLLVRASNTSYISLFDKSDEALINDYEEILQILESEDNPLAEAFGELIKSFIYKDPEPFTNIVQDEWDESETSEKLVYPAQYLLTVNKDKYW